MCECMPPTPPFPGTATRAGFLPCQSRPGGSGVISGDPTTPVNGLQPGSSQLFVTQDAAAVAEAFRRRLIGRAEMAAAADWLGGRKQLGTEVFERGAPERPRGAGRGKDDDITALLRACLLVLAVPEDAAAAFRVAVPFWSVADAVGWMRRVLAGMGAEEVGLEAFFPVVPLEALDRERRCRAAVASTFVSSLELARDGVITLTQLHGSPQIARRTPETVA